MTDDPNTPALWTAIFLYGDSFAARAPDGKKGTKAFATGAVVQTGAVANMMFTVGLARLATHGAIRLVPFSRKRFGLMPTSGIEVEPVDPSLAPEPDDPLAKGALTAKRGGKLRTVRQIVESLVPKSEDPHTSAVGLGVNDAVKCGYLERVTTGGLLRHHHELVPHAKRIAELEPLVKELSAEWAAFSNADKDFAGNLRDQVDKGIRAAYRSDDRGVDD